jgi:hypothetical protein
LRNFGVGRSAPVDPAGKAAVKRNPGSPSRR